MLKPIRLELDNFRSFRGLHAVDFTRAGGLVLVSGHYDSNSALSSGSGKSSLILAMAYALGVCDIPATELRNKNEKNMSVSLFLANEKDEVIEVKRSPKLSITINGQDMSGMSADLEGYLDNLVGVPRSILKNVVFRMQRTHGSFINFTDTQKKEFLAATLGLDEIEHAVEQLNNDIKSKESRLTGFKGQLIAYESQVRMHQHVSQQTIDDLKSQIFNLKSRASSEVGGAEKEMACKASAMNSEIKTLKNQIGAISILSAEQKNIEQNAKYIAAQIQKAQDNICPTCAQSWDNNHLSVEKMKSELKSCLDRYASNAKTISDSSALNLNLAHLEQQYLDICAAIARMTGERTQDRALLSSLESQLASYENAQYNFNNITAQLESIKKQISDLEKDISIDQLSAQAIGRTGFLGVFFGEVLNEISSEANKLMAKIPNVQDLTVMFGTETITKSGTAKNQISTELYKSGQPVVYKNLSGGQQSSLELCVDLAVRAVVLRRNGIQLNFAAMDEALDGLDTENKYSALEVIKTNITGTVLVIDHSTEIKELFDQVVTVYNDGTSSRTIYEKAQASA